MEPTAQHYGNHTQFYPLYHYFTSPVAGIYFIWTVVRAVQHPDADHAYALVGALAILGLVAVARLSPLRAQDRLIRLEERIRMHRVLAPDLVARAEAALRIRHYIALRFASDAELPTLVEQVLAKPDMTPKQIKQQIRTWRGDYFRV